MGVDQTKYITKKNSVVQLQQFGVVEQDYTVKLRSKRDVLPDVIGEAFGIFDALFGGVHGIEMPQVTESKNITTEVPPVTKEQNATTEISPVTKEQNVTTAIPQATRVQNVTTKMPRVIDRKCAVETYESVSLHSAAALGDLNTVKYFVEEKRTYVSDNNRDGDTALHLAAKCGHLDVVKYLVGKRAYIYSKNNHDYTPLHQAAGNGQLDVVKYLVGKKSDLMAVESGYGLTPLHVAAENGQLSVVKYLVEKGANLDASDIYGDAPLHRAAQKGQLDVVKYLIESVVDINIRKRHCNIALLSSAMYGNLDMVKLLIENGTDINAKDIYKNTALHNAANNGHLDVVRYLVEKGADVNAKTDYNRTPLDFAENFAEIRGNSEVFEFLSSHQHGSRNRREVSNNSWNVFNWVKGLISSTKSPALLTSGEHNNHTIAATPEINTLVNNTLLLGILATGSQKLPLHENLLSPIEQSMGLNKLDEVERTLREAEEKYGPSSSLNDVLVHNNQTRLQR